jgi:DNA ligase-1
MIFKDLSDYLHKLENTTSRNEMVEILAQLFEKTPASDIESVSYLLQGRVAPLFAPLEFGMADKMIIKAIAQGYEIEEKEVTAQFKKIGDIGQTAEELAQKVHKKSSDISIQKVFETLLQIAHTNGSGSVEQKVSLLSDLFKSLDSLSVRFVARIPVGKLRLGFSDMTVLDALSWEVSGTKEYRKTIEGAFNVRPDLGFIAKTVKEKGVEGLSHTKPEVFTPILMARAERLSSGEEIIEKIGECAIEPKYDGFRLQAHVKKGKVKLFTRGLEEVTFMYPDVEEGIQKQIKADETIFEGEALAYNPLTNEYLPFQETTQRKRKFNIEEMAKKIPLKLLAFDLLYVNSKNLIQEPYTTRREELKKIVREGDDIIPSQVTITDDPKQIEHTFDEYITEGLEGIVAKRLDGGYQAGARGYNWIKLKRSYAKSALNDTIDCVVLGYYYGQGKRTAFGIGAFLIGVYDEKKDMFVTVAKIGTGLTDNEWRELAKRSDAIRAKVKPPLYEVDRLLEPDVWTEPDIVVEVRADEITRSPIHTAGRVMKASKSGAAFDVDVPGYALRFPRLERFRDDKKPEDATSLKEVEEIFQQQGKKK